MTHARIKQYRPSFKGMEAVPRTIELARHRQCVGNAFVAEDTEVGAAKNFRLGDEVDAVLRGGDTG